MVKMAIRWSGFSLFAGALFLGVTIAIVSLGRLGLSSPLVDSMLLAGTILMMLGWPGMYAYQSEAAGWLGLVGHGLLEAGNVLIVVAAAQPLFTPAIRGLAESAAAFFLAITLLLGFMLTAVATLRAAVYPRWSGILLLGAGLGFFFDFFVSEDWPPIAGLVSGIIFGLLIASAFGWIGATLWRGAAQPAG